MQIIPAPVLPPAYVFPYPEEITVSVFPLIPGRGKVVRRARGSVRVAPTGADITVLIKRFTLSTGVVVDTLGTLTISATAFTGSVTFATAVVVLETQGVTAEITQIGSTLPGEDLAIEVD